MYDSIGFYVPNGHVDESVLAGVSYKTKANSGEASFKGYLRNLHVIQWGYGVSFAGSLARYLYGENFTTLRRADVLDAIASIEAEVGLDLSGAVVTRLEFGTTLCVFRPPREYMDMLEYSPRRPKTSFHDNGTVEFGNLNSLLLAFYDKGKEAKTIPDEWKGKHALRVELRLRNKRAIRRCLDRDILLPELEGSVVHDAFLRRLKAEYTRIHKHSEVRFELVDAPIRYTPSMLGKLALVRDVEAVGYGAYMRNVDAQKVSGVIDSQTCRRMKQKVRSLYESSPFVKVPSLIEELDSLIAEL